MKSKFLIVCLLVGAGTWLIGNEAFADNVPEEACFSALQAELKDHSHLSHLVEENNKFKPEKLVKINQWRLLDDSNIYSGTSAYRNSNGELLSEYQPFNYANFQALAKLSVPYGDQIEKYPHQVETLPPDQVQKIPAYKARRTNIAPIILSGGTSTKIDATVQKKAQYFNGYYIDTQIYTFGRQAPFTFPFAAFRPDPTKNNGTYINGQPFADMREYILYTHHLASSGLVPEAERGKFLSCGLVQLAPRNPYVLNAVINPKKKTLTHENLGGNTFKGTTLTQTKNHDEKFRILTGNLRVKSRRVIDGTPNYNGDLMDFNIIALGYDNKSSFYNEFHTLAAFETTMTRTSLQRNKTVWDAITAYLSEVKKQKQGIMKSRVIKSYTQKKQSLSDARHWIPTAQAQSFNPGQVVALGNVPWTIMRDVQNLPNPEANFLLQTALIGPDLVAFSQIPPAKRTSFQQAALENPMPDWQRVENVQYVLDSADDQAEITPESFQYKDLAFGEAVIPVADARVRALSTTSPLESELQELLAQKEAELARLEPSSDADLIEADKIKNKRREIEALYDGYIGSLLALEERARRLQMEILDFRLQLEHGRITQAEFDEAMAQLYQHIKAEFEGSQYAQSLKENLDLSRKFFVEPPLETQTTSSNITPQKPLSLFTPEWHFQLVAVFVSLLGVCLFFAGARSLFLSSPAKEKTPTDKLPPLDL